MTTGRGKPTLEDALAHHQAGRLAEAHRNLSHVLLLQGRLAEDWPEFEWRWRCRDFPSERRGFAQRPWAGAWEDVIARVAEALADEARTEP